MDEVTKTTLTNFVNFLELELKKDKRYRDFQVTHWGLKDFRVTVTAFINGTTIHLYFDWREIKENPHHFSHLLPSATDQLVDYIG